MTFTRRLEFYELPSSFNFPSIINKVHLKPLNKLHNAGGRILKYTNTSIALVKFDDDIDYIEGLLVRVTSDDVPMKASLLRNHFEKIILKSDEGIADMTYFIFIKSIKVLCLLPAKNGVKWGTFVNYVNEIAEINDFELFPLINKDANKTLNSWKHITSILAEIKIGNNSRPTSKATQQLPLGLALDETKRMNTARIKLELYNPKRKGGLVANLVKQLSKTISSLSGELEVKHLTIKGSNDSDSQDAIIDLISQRFMISVNLGSAGRSLDYDECSSAVKTVIQNQITAIGELID